MQCKPLPHNDRYEPPEYNLTKGPVNVILEAETCGDGTEGRRRRSHTPHSIPHSLGEAAPAFQAPLWLGSLVAEVLAGG